MRWRHLPLTVLLTTACYQYSSANPAPISTGTWVRIQLIRAADQRSVARYGEPVQFLEGKFVAATTDSLTIAVERVTQPDGYSHGWAGEQIRIPRNEIIGIEQETFAPLRTAGAAAGVAVIVTVLMVILFGQSR